jgi:hypothetical protein
MATLRALRVLDWSDSGAAVEFPGSPIDKPPETHKTLSGGS